MESGTKGRRSDATRNRARILEIAEECFAEHGLEVPLDTIAKQAGVGAEPLPPLPQPRDPHRRPRRRPHRGPAADPPRPRRREADRRHETGAVAGGHPHVDDQLRRATGPPAGSMGEGRDDAGRPTAGRSST
ncbi:hypothetical protein QP028_05445 [Corynebacterium suedekumii]|nr:hypothetical protein QP028_05445 [Corynebacterium suedekumii]